MSKIPNSYRHPIKALCACGYLGFLSFFELDELWQQPTYKCPKCDGLCWAGGRSITYTGKKKKEIEARLEVERARLKFMEKVDTKYKQRCSKQHVLAILVKGDAYWVGSNWVNHVEQDCPREVKYMKTGEGYELCKKICKQNGHAELDVLAKAGASASGATLYLLGHSYICSNCGDALTAAGVTDRKIGEIPDLTGKTRKEKP